MTTSLKDKGAECLLYFREESLKQEGEWQLQGKFTIKLKYYFPEDVNATS